ncbi:uncharacterized protein LOC134211485 [Armigeres subalbatus]|uniref:uncharacterized protein LOC134211485 n=1 Tax=Armigeres subalbatus TaxID=124917 RepID=UPI002ED16AB5
MLSRLLHFSLKTRTVLVPVLSPIKCCTPRLCVRPISTSLAMSGPRTMKEERYRKKDKVPEDYRIIYRAPMEHYLSACSLVTSFSFAAISVFAAYGYMHDYHTLSVPFEIDFQQLTANETDLLIFLGFFFAVNVLIRIMVNRYVLRIYRNEDDYLAVFEGNLPFSRKQLKYKKGTVEPVPEGGIVPWQDARYKINDKSVLIIDGYFRTPSELYNMLKQNKQ